MIKKLALLACAASLVALPLAAAEEPAKVEHPSPPEIVAKAKPEEWVAIAPSDLLVMELVGVPDGKLLKPRRVVIQLMPAPFNQGWVGNIRKLAAAKFWDGTSVNRVQDNYVVQWGDATEKKALPEGLATVPESNYVTSSGNQSIPKTENRVLQGSVDRQNTAKSNYKPALMGWSSLRDVYSMGTELYDGWPIARGKLGDESIYWPTHCYGMVGVGRNLSPDTGTGAELYTVIGHAPRHLDRNIALVGRVIEGIEHLSSLPRGTGPLGFYEKELERVPILSVRIASEMVTDKPFPIFEYLSTESESFAKYADARANRRDPFFNVPAGGADICNIPVPVRRKAP